MRQETHGDILQFLDSFVDPTVVHEEGHLKWKGSHKMLKSGVIIRGNFLCKNSVPRQTWLTKQKLFNPSRDKIAELQLKVLEKEFKMSWLWKMQCMRLVN